MIGFWEGLIVTLKTTFRRPVTAQYPDPKKRQRVAYRYMGFPGLLWDYDVSEPYCTGCMVCVRDCPTQCMTAQMMDNPKYAEGKSRRRKIINDFEINLGRCILCGICVDVCNFDAIEMTHEHELSKFQRNSNRVNLQRLVEMGKEFQQETNWNPSQPEKNSGLPMTPQSRDGTEKKAITSTETLGSDSIAGKSKESMGNSIPDIKDSRSKTSDMSKEQRVAEARARALAKRKNSTPDVTNISALDKNKNQLEEDSRA